MHISWEWLGELVDLSGLEGPSALGELLTSRGLEVEGIRRMDEGLEDVVVAQILEKASHPDADRLSLCQVSPKKGQVLQIVCGAKNMKAGDKVALANVGAHLPNGLKIAKSKIRGVESFGMLCSESELGFSEESDGIIILPESAELGIPFAQYLGKKDTILELKLTANRGDCLSHWGIAREVAAALGKKLRLPQSVDVSKIKRKSPIQIELKAGEKAPQFLGCLLEGVKIGPSPKWMQERLESVGIRAINNVVDASNWVLLELGHPNHAYDANEIKKNKIGVRLAKAGEKALLLDGETVDLTDEDLVIFDGERIIGLGGVMGGGNSEVKDQTTRLFLECAEFDPSLVRKTSTRLQKKSEAAHRFERGIDPEGLERAMGRLIHLIQETAGGEVTGVVSEKLTCRKGAKPTWKKTVSFEKEFIREFLGFSAKASKSSEEAFVLTDSKMKQILKQLDCEIVESGEKIKVTPPSYRWDLSIREDIAEEIARSVGYDKIPSTIPPLSGNPVFAGSSRGEMDLVFRAKAALMQAGLSETVNFAFTSGQWLSKFGYESQVRLVNPLSEEFEYLVPSLVPGLVRNALDNWNHHFGAESIPIRLFEFRPVFSTSSGETFSKIKRESSEMETGVVEKWKLSFCISGPRLKESLANENEKVNFFDLKAVVENLLEQMGTKGARIAAIEDSEKVTGSSRALFHPGQTAELRVGKLRVGCFGQLHPGLAQELKTREPLWIGELDWEALTSLSRQAFDANRFQSWPRFPSIERDFALLVKDQPNEHQKIVTSDQLCRVALRAGKPVAQVAKIFDRYQGSKLGQGMTSLAVRVIFYNESRSLEEKEAEEASARILDAWKKELGVELRSD